MSIEPKYEIGEKVLFYNKILDEWFEMNVVGIKAFVRKNIFGMMIQNVSYIVTEEGEDIEFEFMEKDLYREKRNF